MRFEELLQKNYQKGRQEGVQTMIILAQKLIEAGEADKISMLSDEDYLDELCLKYGISSEIAHNV